MSRTEVRTKDKLLEINGVKPKVILPDGTTLNATSESSDRLYTMKRTGDHYYCTCPAWRRAAGAVNSRTCKHLQSLFGVGYEEARLELTNPSTTSASTPNSSLKRKAEDLEAGGKGKGKAKAKAAADEESTADEEEEEGEETEDEVATEEDVAPRGGRRLAKRASPDDDDEEEEDEEEEAARPAVKRARGERKVKTGVVSDEELSNAGAGAKPARSAAGSSSSSAAGVARPKRKVEPVQRLAKDVSFKPLLAEKWDIEKGKDPKGYLISEKLDGVRAYWNGKNFQSREGNPFYAPEWFTKKMPKDICLDGELFTTRGDFQKCVSIVRTQNNPDAWKFSVSYQIFDCPSKGDEPFEDRIAFVQETFKKLRIRWVHVLAHTECKSRKHLLDMLDDICAKGGEGLMLREPGSAYVNGRSKTLLKVKRFLDADAIVRGHERGTGKNANCTGALRVEMLDAKGRPTGKLFKIGSGLTDQQRRSPPKIGATVIYRYQELSNSGTPRFPTFVGERAD
ncbi:uncharacterized protein LAJ45_03358 [Morchella importuna]|uniref:uncharacterized protein n=1 Tax=Morchella importuna TaxID=1174673 RepID=UPI001E8E70A8|nr:uncharacterized protein LAJ45_03358 [Morchella importuna]KAH8152518.1 hypothetical protein LAJ45_03358 [Morchella importuna]